ncbi:MAG: L-2-hydroxyglutarate oxidase [Planctomycetota bacterium]
MQSFDVAIIGGGIVGLAIAHRLLERQSSLGVVVVEKEHDVAAHQSSHNSGVLHSGVYYTPGSLKATCCRRGNLLMQDFCRDNDVPLRMSGKLIVAVSQHEIPRLRAIAERGHANGVRAERIGPERMREIEPAVRGLQALHVLDAGVLDYAAVCRALERRIIERGGLVRTGTAVHAIRADDHVTLETTTGDVRASHMINAAGLHSDRILRMSGGRPSARIIPFRGEFHRLSPDARRLCATMIYPVPDPALPFLGVHLTRTITGDVECGPNALFSFAREGYDRGAFDLRDAAASLGRLRAWRLFARMWRTGLGELHRSRSMPAMTKALRQYVPEIRAADLSPARSGVRAQAVDRRGRLIDDFLLAETDRAVHLCNAPSPAATASLAIADHVIDIFEKRTSLAALTGARSTPAG